MLDDATPAEMAYICECGKKWTFGRKTMAGKSVTTVTCDCGRLIQIGNGIAYSPGKAPEKKARR